MKRVLIVVVLVVAAAVLGLWRSHGGVRAGLRRVVGADSNISPAATTDEIRKTFDLKPGALVQVQGINGRVEITTADVKTAEVHVLRIANDGSSMARREIVVEATSDGFIVRGKQNRVGLLDRLFGRDPREDVTIKAPRQIALSLKGIDGNVTTGEVDGSLEVKGINGRLQLGPAADTVQIAGINGFISVGIRELSERGARLSGINGGIELRLANGLNADLSAKGMNGSVRSEIPGVTVEKEDLWSRYSARIGSGGPPIDISGINGNVRLTRGESSSAASSSN